MSKVANVVYTGSLHNDITHLASGAVISTDAPVDNHGKGEAFSPSDLLASAVAACAITVMGIKASDMGVNMDGTRAEVAKEMATNPRRVSAVTVDFYLPAALDAKSRTILEATAHACPVSKSLSADVVQTLRFHYA
ncbi:MAG: OsmC family protein [Neisseria sp.]|nr:OsmC family protein [Neisseria sp.]